MVKDITLQKLKKKWREIKTHILMKFKGNIFYYEREAVVKILNLVKETMKL